MADNVPTLAVTGATGALGGAVARLLAEAGVRQRLLARRTARLPELPDTPVFAASYLDRPQAVSALRGVHTLFMVSAAESPHRVEDQCTFVDAAVEAGVEHIVYTSFMGASAEAVFTLARDHAATEEYISSREGLSHTFLRDCLYQDVLPTFIQPDGVIRGPAGEGRFAPVARIDIARTAARILLDPEPHRDRTYTLTGPAELTMGDVAGILARVTGRPVRYESETYDEAIASRMKAGAARWQAEAWTSSYHAIAAGQLAPVSPDIERLTGIAPLGFEDYLQRATK
ncbi:SDR family oxidoreductase [Arthrobacter sp. zg-Y877]|uniref:SDR family oxidoreductase n=1 Tax=Arthrobacter sp. zg-Y877 TaxID=3049074 RepID=UPI0025A43125|nr:SDR family oxidoreductase [Arthrobacter sp. zg-Y877]MDM7988985.1 SDR family oxidoreductase [Arthrobacter sp. zg-Y877]